jgi:hypothetical protein
MGDPPWHHPNRTAPGITRWCVNPLPVYDWASRFAKGSRCESGAVAQL